MNFYERASSLKLRLETSQRDDQSQDLQQGATALLRDLCARTAFLEQIVGLQGTLDPTERPKLDEARLRKTVGGFRSALTQYSAAAVQQQAAATLRDVTGRMEDGLARWAHSRWRASFDDLSRIADDEGMRSMVGPPAKVARARKIASHLRLAIEKNPIRDVDAIQRTLGVEGLGACAAKVWELGDELRALVNELQRSQAELPLEVQQVLEQADRDAGFSLEDMTEELLKALREAGVLGEFVVRRR